MILADDVGHAVDAAERWRRVLLMLLADGAGVLLMLLANEFPHSHMQMNVGELT